VSQIWQALLEDVPHAPEQPSSQWVVVPAERGSAPYVLCVVPCLLPSHHSCKGWGICSHVEMTWSPSERPLLHILLSRDVEQMMSPDTDMLWADLGDAVSSLPLPWRHVRVLERNQSMIEISIRAEAPAGTVGAVGGSLLICNNVQYPSVLHVSSILDSAIGE